MVIRLIVFLRRYRDRGGELPAPSILDNVRMSSSQSGKSLKFVFVKKHEICRPSNERDKCCRVMAVSEYQVGNRFSAQIMSMYVFIPRV